MTRKTAVAAATVANLGPGFDVLGLCLEGPRDTVTAELTTDGLVTLVDVTGPIEVVQKLSGDALQNCAGVSAKAVLDAFAPGAGVRLWLDKGLPLGSGLGSSSASSVAAAVATAACIDPRMPKDFLFSAVREGERLATGTPHPDNVAPCLFGGIVACLHGDDEHVDLVTLPVPRGLMVVAVKPDFEVKTADARAVLPKEVPMKDAVRNLGAMAGLVKALATSDFQLLGRCLEDRLATPYRKRLIPGYDDAVEAALAAHAIGAGISGSGPAMFALCGDRDDALAVADAMVEAFERRQIKARAIVSAIDLDGAQVVS
ncbi:MAG: homoserine kinase [Deltaproteobacteria bacterium]|nr:homoserine kinase [Deltaproteobacteria bacterium]